MRATITLAGMALLTSPAIAETLDIEIGIPRLDVAEYHRPYVAAWIARPDNSVAANLAVWYQQERRGENEGETWLKDLRQWWRRTGIVSKCGLLGRPRIHLLWNVHHDLAPN